MLFVVTSVKNVPRFIWDHDLDTHGIRWTFIYLCLIYLKVLPCCQTNRNIPFGFIGFDRKKKCCTVFVHCCRAESVYTKQSSQRMKYAPRCIPHTLGLSTFLHEHRHKADENLGLDTAFLWLPRPYLSAIQRDGAFECTATTFSPQTEAEIQEHFCFARCSRWYRSSAGVRVRRVKPHELLNRRVVGPFCCSILMWF